MQLPNKKKVWDNPIYDKLCAVRTQMNAFAPNLIMDDITGETMDEYQNFLIKRGFKNSTIEKHICYLRQILDWSNKRGYLKHGESIIKHKTPKLELSKPKATNYLTWEEFEEMYNYEFGPGQEHLEITRDRFCFCCATSLRHSDLEILKKSHFHNENGNEFFSLISKKTHDDLIIPLNDYSRALYYKYKDVDSKNGLLFPSKSNQKMNDNLKTIAKLLGFTREVSKMQFCGKRRVDEERRLCDVIGTHSARRTFVVHSLSMGMTPEEVMSFTGHEDYDTMKPYIAVTQKKRFHDMENCFKMGEGK